MKTGLLRVGLALVVLSFFIFTNLFAQGTLDPTFGTGGFVLTTIQDGRDDISQSVVVQPDKKIVIAGNSFNAIGYSNIGVVRYKPNGKPDNTFNQTGIQTINDGFCNIVALQSDGKIVIGGSVAQGSSTLFGVWRLNTNGSVDNTFGTNGFKSIAFSGYVICFSMIIQPDDKILIAGNDGNFYAGHASMAIARLTPDGSLDNTFSGDGKFTLNLTNKSLTCQRLLLQPDGKILAAGTLDTIIQTAFFRNEFFCARLMPDGTIDNTFGVNGIFRQRNSNSDNCYAAGLMPDGKVLLAGFSEFTGYNSASVICLKPNGTVNTSYGTLGWKYLDFYGGSPFINGLAIQKNGKAIFAGTTYMTSQTAMVVGRLQKNGTLDNTFATEGMDTFFLSSSSYPVSCNDITLQKDVNIIITGYKASPKDKFITARLLNLNQLEKTEMEVPPAEASAFDNLSIYPNPASVNEMTLAFDLHSPLKLTISVSDLQGKQVIAPIMRDFAQGENTVELRLPDQALQGIYLCEVHTSQYKQTITFEFKK